MTSTTTTQPAARTTRYAGLAAGDWGHEDDRPPLLLLHGMTFDRTMWPGIVTELQRIDPGRRVVTLDLPGHGESPDQSDYDLPALADRVNAAVEEAGLVAPVVVGHSAAAGIASVYAASHPTRGVVNIDSSPVVVPFATFIRSIGDRLRGPEFPALWQIFYDGFHVELLRPDAQELVRTTCRPRQDVVLGYWRALLEDPIEQLTDFMELVGKSIEAAGIPYLYLAGADLDADTKAWLDERASVIAVEVWPGTGHFPHLAHPARFAALLAKVGQAAGSRS